MRKVKEEAISYKGSKVYIEIQEIEADLQKP